MCGGRGRCVDYDGGYVQGDGNCKVCHGTGTNVHLNSDSPVCEKWQGQRRVPHLRRFRRRTDGMTVSGSCVTVELSTPVYFPGLRFESMSI